MQSAQDYLKTINSFDLQFSHAFNDIFAMDIDAELGNVNDVIVSGMGGSDFGGRTALGVFGDDKLLVPLRVLNDYELPAYADEKTLVILSSNSGSTEEVLFIEKQAIERGCKIFGITTGKDLGASIQAKKFAGYIYDPIYNYSASPRTSIGYSVGATIGLLSKLKLLNFTKEEADQTAAYMKSFTQQLEADDSMQKKLSEMLVDGIPVIISADHLRSATFIWRNFMNETAKHTGFVMEIPNLNHHFLEGFAYPKTQKDSFLLIYVNSPLFNDRVKTRFNVTRGVTQKFEIPDFLIETKGTNKFNDFWEIVIIGGLVSYNLSQIHGVNPATNELVDFLKQSLGKPNL